MTTFDEFARLDPPHWAEMLFIKLDALEQWIRHSAGPIITAAQSKRQHPTASTKAELSQVVWLCYMRHCPCCLNTVLFGPDCRRLQSAQFDHWLDNPNKRLPWQMWLICSDCHANFTRGLWRREECQARFETFQQHRRAIQAQLPFQLPK